MAFAFYRTLTIDHTQCGSAPSSSFPVLVSGSHPTLRSVANGGHIQSSTAADLLFFADFGGVTQYPSEIEFYDALNGIVVAWVQVPTVSNTVDTLLYALFGNASPPARTTNPWDANFKLVMHLAGPVLSVADSTTNANNGTNAGATAATGQIDGGANFVAVSSQHVVGPTINMTAYAGVTLSCWVNPTTFQSVFPNISTVLGEDGNGGLNGQIRFGDAGLSKDLPEFVLGIAGAANVLKGSIPFTLGSWQHVAATYDGTTMRLFRNGVQDTSAVHAGAISANSPFWLGASQANARYWDGLLDEARLSSVDRGADWILTEYNNQLSPGNIGAPGFITWGAETSPSTGGRLLLMGVGS